MEGTLPKLGKPGCNCKWDAGESWASIFCSVTPWMGGGRGTQKRPVGFKAERGMAVPILAFCVPRDLPSHTPITGAPWFLSLEDRARHPKGRWRYQPCQSHPRKLRPTPTPDDQREAWNCIKKKKQKSIRDSVLKFHFPF